MNLSPHQLRRLRSAPVANGNRVRLARQLLKLTQEELSAQIQVTQTSISDLERNRYGTTTVETARKYANFFGCRIEDLFPAAQEQTV